MEREHRRWRPHRHVGVPDSWFDEQGPPTPTNESRRSGARSKRYDGTVALSAELLLSKMWGSINMITHRIEGFSTFITNHQVGWITTIWNKAHLLRSTLYETALKYFFSDLLNRYDFLSLSS